MYALVTPKGHLISGAAILNNENWLGPLPTADGGKDLGWFPVDIEPKVPAPDRTLLEQIDLLVCMYWSLEDCKEATGLL